MVKIVLKVNISGGGMKPYPPAGYGLAEGKEGTEPESTPLAASPAAHVARVSRLWPIIAV